MTLLKSHGLTGKQACFWNEADRKSGETMHHAEKRLFLIRSLLKEQPRYNNVETPSDHAEQRRMLRSLFNIRMPGKVDEGFLAIQDAYLREETQSKGITAFSDLVTVPGTVTGTVTQPS